MQKRLKKQLIFENDNILKIGKNEQNRQFWGQTFKCQEHVEDDSNTTFVCSMKPFL